MNLIWIKILEIIMKLNGNELLAKLDTKLIIIIIIIFEFQQEISLGRKN